MYFIFRYCCKLYYSVISISYYSFVTGLSLILKNFDFSGVQLIYNVVLVSGVQQSGSVTHIHVVILFSIFYLFLAVLGPCCCTHKLSLVVESKSYSSLRCTGFSFRWRLCCRARAHGLKHAGPVVGAHRLGCRAACGIFPEQGLNPCPLHWQVCP